MPHSESLGQEELNPEQQEAVKAPDGANLVLAGAGSGKTRVLIHRILHLLKAGAPPESILAITFTNKAAGEMKARLAAALGPAARPAWVGTFHAAGARILRAEGAALGISPHFAIMARGESLRLLKREMAAERVNPERYDPRAILERISAHKSAGRPLGNDDGVPFSLESVAAKLLPRYERAVRDAGALDFDDLLALPLRLFQENPDILSRYQRRFSEILVDEYQDTNAVQSRLVKALAGEAPRVFAVGDDDQSIYGWRGADVGNIRRFEADFPGARVYRLERNYRSSGRILQAASAVMANAPGRQEKRLLAQNPEGAPVLYIGAADPDTEAQMIFQRFAALGAGAEIPWGESAIFYRINTQSRPLEEEARRRRIPYQVVKGQRFFDRAEVQDAAAYLRVLLRPEDESAFARIVNRPPRGLGQVRLQEMAAGGRLDRNVAREALVAGRVRGAAAKALDGLLGVFDELSAKRAGPAQMIGALLAQSGYHAWLREQAERSASPETRQKAARALDGVGEFAAAAL
ncbi:MAG: UvrD-helicase domain-containing protein, partial [bacterium]|nr:UvrD-helicase domain-containing protein [bacterium]